MKRIRKMGLFSGMLALVVCESPWVLALLGFGALSLNLEKLPMRAIELTGVALILFSIGFWLYKRRAGKMKA